MAAERTPPVVALRGAHRWHPGPPPVQALRPTDLVIPPGCTMAITGPSGAGKTTLLQLLGLLDRPSGGTILVGDIETSALPDSRRDAIRRQLIGFVFQRFHLLDRRSTRANVELGLLYHGASAAERHRRAAEVLEQVGLAGRADAPAGVLSGGEQQRVAIARALVSRPRVLLCDEPTGNLDRGSGQRVLGLLDALGRSGTSVVIATHDPEVAERATLQVTMVDGAVTVHP